MEKKPLCFNGRFFWGVLTTTIFRKHPDIHKQKITNPSPKTPYNLGHSFIFQDGLLVVQPTTNYPWTPKPWKMKVLHPQYMGYNP